LTLTMYDLNKNRNIAYICLLYRAASFFMMMVFIYNGQFYPSYDAANIIFPLLGIASVISLTMYMQIKQAPNRVRVTLEFETIFIFFLYLITGGLYSPVIWMVTVPSIQFLFLFKRKYYVLYILTLLLLTSIIGPFIINEPINTQTLMYLPNFILAVTMLLIIALLSRQYHNNDTIHRNLVDAQQEIKNLLLKNEQKRIAEEIHDGVKQDIHGASYLLYDVIKRFDHYTPEEKEEKLNIIYDAIKDAGQSLRKVIYNLDQSDDVYSWLQFLNKEVIMRSKLYGITINMNPDEEVKSIGSISISLFNSLRRIFKETVANSVERGNAQNIWIKMQKQEQYLYIKISDDGTGFADLSSIHYGIGMRSLRKLTGEHKGSMNYYNGTDKGAVVEMKLMYKS